MWVATHKMPPAIPGTRKWDKRAIDAKLDEISGLAPASQAKDPYDEWIREYRKKRASREAFAPQVSLREAPRRVLMFMVAHPDCDTIDEIRGAGQRTIDKLIKVGLSGALARTPRASLGTRRRSSARERQRDWNSGWRHTKRWAPMALTTTQSRSTFLSATI
jgi:hypothetical protein